MGGVSDYQIRAPSHEVQAQEEGGSDRARRLAYASILPSLAGPSTNRSIVTAAQSYLLKMCAKTKQGPCPRPSAKHTLPVCNTFTCREAAGRFSLAFVVKCSIIHTLAMSSLQMPLIPCSPWTHLYRKRWASGAMGMNRGEVQDKTAVDGVFRC